MAATAQHRAAYRRLLLREMGFNAAKKKKKLLCKITFKYRPFTKPIRR